MSEGTAITYNWREHLRSYFALNPRTEFATRLSVTHWTIDVGLVFPLMDKFFEYLIAELEERAGNIKEPPWGDEIAQLPPSISAVIAPPYRGEVIPPMPTDSMPVSVRL